MRKIYAWILKGMAVYFAAVLCLGCQGIAASEAANEQYESETERIQSLSFSFLVPYQWEMEQVNDVLHLYFAVDENNWADIALFVDELTPDSIKPAIWEKTTLQREKNEGEVEYDFPRYEKDSVLFTRWYNTDGSQIVLMATDTDIGIISYLVEGEMDFQVIIQDDFEYFLQSIQKVQPEEDPGSEEVTSGNIVQSPSSGAKPEEEGTFSSQGFVFRIPEGWETLDMEGGYTIFRTEEVGDYGLVSILTVSPAESDPPITEWMDAMMEDARETSGLEYIFPRYTKDGIHFARWYDDRGYSYALAATENEYAVITFREEGDYDDFRIFQRDFEWFLTGITVK